MPLPSEAPAAVPDEPKRDLSPPPLCLLGQWLAPVHGYIEYCVWFAVFGPN